MDILKSSFSKFQTGLSVEFHPQSLKQAESATASGPFFEIFNTMEKTEVVLAILIAVIMGFCLLFLSLAVLRRLYNSRRYAILDHLRSTQLSMLNQCIQDNAPTDQYLRRFKADPGSMAWLALEHNLFLLTETDGTRAIAFELFEKLGYIEYYMRILKSRKVIARVAAVSKLGRMGNAKSSKPLLAMLDSGNPEIVTAAVRAVSKLGDASALSALLERLPRLLQGNLVTSKTIDASLAAGGPGIIPILLDYAKTCEDAAVLASLETILSDFPPSREVYDFACSRLNHPDAEVRAKALKLIAKCEKTLGVLHDAALQTHLLDPIWFVRLQAVRTLGRRRQEKNARAIASLLIDERWQVRNEAALALTLLGGGAMDAFLALLRSNDRYAKESVCEEMEKSDFFDIVLNLLKGPNAGDAAKARELLAEMASCGFKAPMEVFLASQPDPLRAAEIQAILDGVKP